MSVVKAGFDNAKTVNILIGNMEIIIGQMNNLEDKFSRLLAFYKNIAPSQGWNKYSTVNLKYKNQIVCKLLSMEEPRLTTVKGIRMMTFDVEFKSNLSLPDYMGLGKHVSIGYGTIVRAYNTEKNQ